MNQPDQPSNTNTSFAGPASAPAHWHDTHTLYWILSEALGQDLQLSQQNRMTTSSDRPRLPLDDLLQLFSISIPEEVIQEDKSVSQGGIHLLDHLKLSYNVGAPHLFLHILSFLLFPDFWEL